jgi:hypothetical protein
VNENHYLFHNLIDTFVGCINSKSVFGRHQWRFRAGSILAIPLSDLFLKAREINIETLFLQLFIAPFCPDFQRSVEKYLSIGVQKDYGAHVPPIRNEARDLSGGSLSRQQYRSDSRDGRVDRRRTPSLFATHRISYILPSQYYSNFTSSALKCDLRINIDINDLLKVIRVYAFYSSRVGKRAVQGSAIENVPAKPTCNLGRHSAFAGSARAVDRHHWNL